MTTASGPDPSTASIRPAFPPTSCATSSARCISASPTSISSTAGSRASTLAWRAPIRPAPSSPTFTSYPSLLDAEQGAKLFLPYLEITGRFPFGEEREAGVDPGVDRLAVRGFCGGLDTDLPHRVRVLRHGGVHVAPDDRLALVGLQGPCGAAYPATCDPLDRGAQISPFFRRGPCALCPANPLATLESTACDDATGVPTSRQWTLVEGARSLASDAVPEVRGGCFVEKQYGVGVIPQHRGWHALGDVVLHGRGHGPCLVRTRCKEQDHLRVEDGSHAGRDRALRGSVSLEVGGVDLAGALGEPHDAGAGVERRSWLVEPYVAVAPDPEHAHVDPTGLPYGSLVALALLLGVRGGPVGDEDPRRVDIDEPVEVLLHVYVVTRLVIRRQPKILVEVEEGRVREREFP